jgi:C4-dicarboxylate-specific signal transduction histidine kinase
LRTGEAAVRLSEQKHADEALREAQTNLAHVSRVTAMGELCASLAHEVNQPVAAAVALWAADDARRGARFHLILPTNSYD